MRNTKRKNKVPILTKLSGYSKYLFLAVVVLLFISLVRNIIKSVQVGNRIKAEKTKLEDLKKEKNELERKLAETQSAEYLEKQLRNKLGLAKEGEIILVLPDEETLKKMAPENIEPEEVLPDPTWKKWLKLFQL
jgi:cell division protein FtsB